MVGNLFEARYYHAITTVLLRDVEQLCVSKKVNKYIIQKIIDEIFGT